LDKIVIKQKWSTKIIEVDYCPYLTDKENLNIIFKALKICVDSYKKTQVGKEISKLEKEIEKMNNKLIKLKSQLKAKRST